MVLNNVLNQEINNEEVLEAKNLFAIDYLKLKVEITNNPLELSQDMVIPLTKFDGEFQPLQESYSKQWVCGSHNDKIQIKSINENEIQIKGNLFKWLNGQNVTGTTDLIQLVLDTVTRLSQIFNAITPTDTEIENIKLGLFRIYRIDVNKALLFDDKQKAQQYLTLIKEHGTYPRRDREVEKNGIYFGKRSKRTTLLYYFKGQEVRTHNKQQIGLTSELKEYADHMVRCEVRLFSQQLRDSELQYGYCWDEELIQQLVEDSHCKLNLPEPISEIELPAKYIRFLATQKQGALHIGYTASTTARYKRVLARDYGLMV
ncbi:phage/plasmid replication protein, II/X family [Acinetobacter sp. ANC 4805]|uniref:phage/plasmid replication protein, II/X family n=1 Tax=Acinetobacter sp. ANC 4805 TaxID=2923425 RepID=UPI001F4AEDDE|nr:phage/plasmid replication protein, II/X family [Acinetobacter sp. ANC 4805]MCH7310613.1 phage/plasmid replication protein, II/X family [Acinetobacter sp. ANC 4805]